MHAVLAAPLTRRASAMRVDSPLRGEVKEAFRFNLNSDFSARE
jgi:hypothetical protein